MIKNVDTLIHVIGAFSGRDYAKDIDDMETEFMISDRAIIEKKNTPSAERAESQTFCRQGA
jgi:ribosome-binding ATPase YchF (GTP1/OBG family)